MAHYRSAHHVLLALPVLLLLRVGQAPAEPSVYRVMYDQLTRPVLDENRVAAVRDLVIRRDAGLFTLVDGHLYVCQPLGERVWAMVFVGKGRFSYTPPTSVEREQLLRYLDETSLDQPFRT